MAGGAIAVQIISQVLGGGMKAAGAAQQAAAAGKLSEEEAEAEERRLKEERKERIQARRLKGLEFLAEKRQSAVATGRTRRFGKALLAAAKTKGSAAPEGGTPIPIAGAANSSPVAPQNPLPPQTSTPQGKLSPGPGLGYSTVGRNV